MQRGEYILYIPQLKLRGTGHKTCAIRPILSTQRAFCNTNSNLLTTWSESAMQILLKNIHTFAVQNMNTTGKLWTWILLKNSSSHGYWNNMNCVRRKNWGVPPRRRLIHLPRRGAGGTPARARRAPAGSARASRVQRDRDGRRRQRPAASTQVAEPRLQVPDVRKADHGVLRHVVGLSRSSINQGYKLQPRLHMTT